MLKDTHIAVHLVPPGELPSDTDVTLYVESSNTELHADFYCSEASPQAAREYVVGFITAMRRTQLAI